MKDFLINNSFFIVVGITVAIVSVLEYFRYLREKRMTNSEFLEKLRFNLNKHGNILAIKFLASILITLVISMVSFRQFWMNDCFHIVFLTSILFSPTVKFLNKLVS